MAGLGFERFEAGPVLRRTIDYTRERKAFGKAVDECL